MIKVTPQCAVFRVLVAHLRTLLGVISNERAVEVSSETFIRNTRTKHHIWCYPKRFLVPMRPEHTRSHPEHDGKDGQQRQYLVGDCLER